ncbi:MAG: sigma 54-interacting transcriptional regulator [Sandaracinaceae bacterium]
MTDPRDVSSLDAASTQQAGTIQLPPTGAWALVVGPEGREVVDLPEGIAISIGRSRSSGIVIRDRSVSRLHATLVWQGGDRILLRDHGSKNGIQHASGALRSGDAFEIGPARLVVFAPRPARDVGPSLSVAASMAPALSRVDRAAQTALPVLLLGETGVGKELLAKRVHAQSVRATGPFVAVHCGSIPSELTAATWFGHARGAFTGAEDEREGLFRRADGGTLFLDEVAELSSASQVSLLRALEDRRVTPVGGTHPIAVDVRVVAATHRDLDAAIDDGLFRSDLLYRLDVLRVEVPPLRSRPEDIVWLARQFAQRHGCQLDADAEAVLSAHAWPGNVRELENAVTRAAAVSADTRLRAQDFELGRTGRPKTPDLDGRVADTEREAISAALLASGGNQTRAAQALGISRRALIYRMEKHGLKPAAGR